MYILNVLSVLKIYNIYMNYRFSVLSVYFGIYIFGIYPFDIYFGIYPFVSVILSAFYFFPLSSFKHRHPFIFKCKVEKMKREKENES